GRARGRPGAGGRGGGLEGGDGPADRPRRGGAARAEAAAARRDPPRDRRRAGGDLYAPTQGMIGDRSRDALDLQLLELSAQFLEPFPIGLGFAVVDERPVVLMGRADTDRMLDRAPVLLGASVRSSMRDCRSSWRSTTSSTRRSITGSTSARAARPTIPTRRPKSSPTRSSSMSTGAMRVRRRPPGLGRGNQEADARTRDRR